MKPIDFTNEAGSKRTINSECRRATRQGTAEDDLSGELVHFYSDSSQSFISY
jgi:hypothetical protein